MRFLLGCLLAQALVAWIPASEDWAIRSTLESIRLLFRVFAVPGIVHGDLVRVGDTQIEIVSECTPLMPTLTLASAIMAFPALPSARLIGLLAISLAVWAFNLFRIGTLMAILRWLPDTFDFVHMYLWQTTTLLVMLLLFAAWLRAQGPATKAA